MIINEFFILSATGLFMGMVAVTSGGGATVGVPMVLALGHPATSAVVAVLFGLNASFITGSLTYRRLERPKVILPLYIWPLAIFGSVVGATFFLSIDAKVLRALILILLVIALALTMLVKPDKLKDRDLTSSKKQALGVLVIFLLSIYCGFFGAGFGTFIILALMHFFGYSFLESASAGTRFALIIGGASLLFYMFRGQIPYKLGIPLALGASVGGYVGAVLAQRGGEKFIRITFVASTIILIIKLGFDFLNHHF